VVKKSKSSRTRWDPRHAADAANELRTKTARLMRGSEFMTKYVEQLLRQTHDETIAAEVAAAGEVSAEVTTEAISADILERMRQCFAHAAANPTFRTLARAAIPQEVIRLEEAPLYVIEPAALRELETSMQETDPDSAPVPFNLPTETGYLLLPRPVYTQAVDGTLSAIKAIVWGPLTTTFTNEQGVQETAAGIRLSVYHDPHSLRVAYGLEVLDEIAHEMRPATQVPPLLFRQAELLRADTWDEVIAIKKAQPAPAPEQKVPPKADTAPPGVPVFADVSQVMHLRLMRVFDAYCQQERARIRSSTPQRSGGRGKRRPSLPPTPTHIIYLPEERAVDLPDGSRFTPRGEVKRGFVRRTRAWPVAPVTRTAVDPATGKIVETPVRKAFVQGPDRKDHTYEELRALKDAETTRAVVADTPRAVGGVDDGNRTAATV